MASGYTKRATYRGRSGTGRTPFGSNLYLVAIQIEPVPQQISSHGQDCVPDCCDTTSGALTPFLSTGLKAVMAHRIGEIDERDAAESARKGLVTPDPDKLPQVGLYQG